MQAEADIAGGNYYLVALAGGFYPLSLPSPLVRSAASPAARYFCS